MADELMNCVVMPTPDLLNCICDHIGPEEYNRLTTAAVNEAAKRGKLRCRDASVISKQIDSVGWVRPGGESELDVNRLVWRQGTSGVRLGFLGIEESVIYVGQAHLAATNESNADT